ncbi:DUF1559 domain-containing protein [Alienimonas sp. DA493]|uniref:DUF1559 family PulG-like putative transporter n=1 Tax=Alienimonas sp. DA493 TaxID=3373605 RepID=UPI003755092C
MFAPAPAAPRSRRPPGDRLAAAAAVLLFAAPAPGPAADGPDGPDGLPGLLTYVPGDADFVLLVDARSARDAPAAAALLAGLSERGGPERQLRQTFGFGLYDVERFALSVPRLAGGGADEPGPNRPTAFVVRTVGDLPAPPDAGPPVTQLDARTLRFVPEGTAPPDAEPAESAADGTLLADVLGPAEPAADGAEPEPAEPVAVAAALDVAAVRPSWLGFLDMMKALAGPEGARARAQWDGATPDLDAAQTLLKNVDRLTVGLRFLEGDRLELTAIARSADEPAAARAAAALRTVLVMAGGMADSISAHPGDGPDAPAVRKTFAAIRAACDAAVVAQAGDRVTLTTAAPEASTLLVGLLVPQPVRQSGVERRAASQGNLKQLGLALHNYHAAHGRFPPAVIVENGVARSWRVELLPFLDEADLRARYDDAKPWDDPANAAVLADMPAVFRRPGDDRTEPFAAYFAVLGGQTPQTATAWTPRGEPDAGARIRGALDGTVRTLMLVEAKRPVPWTKPEDLTFDLTRPVDPAPLGGFDDRGFQAATVDGAVHALPGEIDADTLRALLTRRGGEDVRIDEAARRP